MDVANLHVSKGLVANNNTKVAQLIRVTLETPDITSRVANLTWQNVDNNGNVEEPFAHANLIFGEASEWLASWAPISHLLHSRIEALEALAAQGKASRFTRNMAYTLFASNLVDYHDKYRGMQSVVMSEFEAFADVQLTTKESGNWTVAPYFIDSVAHLAGFIMNCSDAMDTQNNYCVTPGWNSMRFAKPLVAGAKYRSYVKMIPTAEDPTVFFGDVYIMQDNVIVGMVGGIKFCRYPRILLSRFFSAPDKSAAIEGKKTAAPAAAPKTVVAPPKIIVPAAKPVAAPIAVAAPAPAPVAAPAPAPVQAVPAPAAAAAAPSVEDAAASGSVTAKALLLIANEAALDIADLEDDADFASLGVDSLMSLVIAEKFRTELDVKVGGSLFLDYPTIGDLRSWLDEYYS